MGSAVSWSMVQEIIPQWLYWKLELMQVIVMGFNPQLTHLFEELQPLRKQGWHLWGLNTQSGDAKWCEMSEWTGTPRSFISFSYETSMSRRHCFVRAHAVWLSSHSMTLGAGGLQPPSPICVHGNTSPPNPAFGNITSNRSLPFLSNFFKLPKYSAYVLLHFFL